MSVELHLGDCLVILSTIPDGSIDMVLADPPYGTTQCKWDSVIPLDAMWDQLRRVTKPRAAIVMTAAQPFTSALVMSNPGMFKYDWVWRKPLGSGHLNAKKQPLRDKEDVLVFYGSQCTYNPQKTTGVPYPSSKSGKVSEGPGSTSSMTESYGKYTNQREGSIDGKRYPKQVQDFGRVERGTVHPTQKPVALMDYMIRTYTNEGETVLDFTMGSGTTGVAAKQLGRNFIGIELDEGYFKIATERIEAVG